MIFRLPYQKKKAISFIERVDKDMICEIKKDRRTRSVVQNNYYWHLMTVMEKDSEIGYTKNEWHAIFRGMFLKAEKELLGKMIEYTRSTTELSTIEMEDYLSQIRTFASAELGCFLPLPGETEHDYLKL